MFLRLCLLCLFAAILFCYRLADRDLWSSHEARAAQDAQTILDDGCWGLPRLFDGRAELQKPPLYYWLVAGFARLHGGTVDAWAVRLPAALAALGCVMAVALLGVRRSRPVAGLVAGMVLATAMHFTALARTGRIDIPLTLAVSLALGAGYLGMCRRHANDARAARAWFLLAYLAVAAAVMLKGPIGAVLPAAVLIVLRLLEHRLLAPLDARKADPLARSASAGSSRPSLALRASGRGQFSSLWWGVPLVAALTLPWYLWANAHTGGEFFQVFFWHHNIERGLGGSTELKSHPWWFYGPQLLFDLLPWSCLLPVAVWYFLKDGRWRLDPEARFGLVWLLTVLAVLSCSRFKRADYLLPAYPGAALFLGSAAERWWQTARHPRRLAAAFGLVVAGCLAGWWVYVDWVLAGSEPDRECRSFAEEIRRLAPAPQRVVFFRAEAHALAFHVGRPLALLVEWPELDALFLARPESAYVVMPAASAEEWPQFLKAGRLEEVLRTRGEVAGGHGKPLVLLRTRPAAPP
jgi:4-amino-4-deoxy-L-arabinose transferase-like glycosyltransferase